MRAKQARAARLAASATVRARRLPLAAADLSKPRSNTAGFLTFALPMMALALLLLGIVLVPARAVPWPEAARLLADRREQLAIGGLAILEATIVSFLALLMS